jgi:hypothetical protein
MAVLQLDTVVEAHVVPAGAVRTNYFDLVLAGVSAINPTQSDDEGWTSASRFAPRMPHSFA